MNPLGQHFVWFQAEEALDCRKAGGHIRAVKGHVMDMGLGDSAGGQRDWQHTSPQPQWLVCRRTDPLVFSSNTLQASSRITQPAINYRPSTMKDPGDKNNYQLITFLATSPKGLRCRLPYLHGVILDSPGVAGPEL